MSKKFDFMKDYYIATRWTDLHDGGADLMDQGTTVAAVRFDAATRKWLVKVRKDSQHYPVVGSYSSRKLAEDAAIAFGKWGEGIPR